jgi:hypothetical protein
LPGKNLAYARLGASFAILGLFAIWTWFYRRSDVLLHLGVGSAVARLWAYHRPYDDVLMVLPAAALFRIAKRGPGHPAWRIAAGALLAFLVASLVGLRILDPLHRASSVIWPLVLVFLLAQAHLERRAERAAGAVVAEVPA